MLPLLDLHRHLDGNIRPSTILDIASKKGLPLARHSLQTLQDLIFIKDKTSDLLAFLQKLDYGVSILTSAEDCYRVAYENVEDAYNEGLAYVELRFSPYYMAISHQLAMHEVIDAVISGVAAGERDFSIKANLIGILSRSFGATNCMNELEAILSRKNNFVAVDLAGDEKAFPAKLFASHFERVRDAGLAATVHAGEADGAQSIWDAIKYLGASRIGHGVAAIDDDALMGYLAEHKIGIEACLTSNYQTGAWSDLPSHPLRTFLAKGIPVSLHTDDPGVSNITLRDEFKLAQSLFNLSCAEVEQLKLNAIEQAFLSDGDKQDLLKGV
ncbi:adenosine deaminase [Agaribacter flavus]|uniref:adenosine deaminase n=1 Tax=Agaribacter flavus TaxID=1902781 RepID=A0ABV7FSH8_9ALTE